MIHEMGADRAIPTFAATSEASSPKAKILGGMAAAAVLFLAAGAAAQERQYVNIGTAGIGGGFYPSGGYVCRLVGKTSAKMRLNVRCTVESTAGSVANLRSLKTGDLEVAFTQAVWQYHAWNGTDVFKDVGPFKELRHLFALHGDALHIVVRKELDINSFADLAGKIVNTGNVGSGTEASIYSAMQQYLLDPKKYFSQETKLTSREQVAKLCDGSIDAFIYPLGLGGASVMEAVSTCDAKVIGWWDGTIEKWVARTPYLNPVTIPANTYAGQDKDVQTYGWQVTLVTTTRLSDDLAYLITKSLFENFDEFKAQSPLYVGITRETSSTYGSSAPLHPGAERYYREAGLIK